LQAAGQIPGGCGWGTGDTMNIFAADDLEAADLLALALALARLDDDGAPPAVTPATGQGAAPRDQPGCGPAP
jgi:hypothetical protein